MSYTSLDRTVACLKGVATGDAIGKQTETLSRSDVLKWYPNEVRGFEGIPGEVIPRYENHHRYSWRIGETTDDTEQTIAEANAIIRAGRINHTEIASELLLCQKSCRPGLSLWSLKESNTPNRVAFDGRGCGAAMRVAPVGILYSSFHLESIVNGAFESSIPTHGDQLAVSGAVAIAVAVSAAIDGKPTDEILSSCIRAAKESEKYRPKTCDHNIADSIERTYTDMSRTDLDAEAISRKYIPKETHDIVSLAIALALLTKSAQQTILLATNIGGDTDSVASMGAAIAAAIRPDTVNDDWYTSVSMVNNIDMVKYGNALHALRR